MKSLVLGLVVSMGMAGLGCRGPEGPVGPQGPQGLPGPAGEGSGPSTSGGTAGSSSSTSGTGSSMGSSGTTAGSTGTSGACSDVAYVKIGLGGSSAPSGIDCPAPAGVTTTFTGIDGDGTLAIYSEPNNNYFLDLGSGVGLEGTLSGSNYSFTGTWSADIQGADEVQTAEILTLTLNSSGTGYLGTLTVEEKCQSANNDACGPSNPLISGAAGGDPFSDIPFLASGVSRTDLKDFDCTATTAIMGSAAAICNALQAQSFDVGVKQSSPPTGTDCPGLGNDLNTDNGIDETGAWVVFPAPNGQFLLEGALTGDLLVGTRSGSVYTLAGTVTAETNIQGTTQTVTTEVTVSLTMTSPGFTGEVVTEVACVSGDGNSCGGYSADGKDTDCTSSTTVFGTAAPGSPPLNPGLSGPSL